MPHGHVAAHGFITHAKVGQVCAHRRSQVDLALLDQPLHRRRGECLRDGRNRKYGVGVDWNRVFDVRDAQPADAHRPVMHNSERDAGMPYSVIFAVVSDASASSRGSLPIVLAGRALTDTAASSTAATIVCGCDGERMED
jgi:hypothetical protein